MHKLPSDIPASKSPTFVLVETTHPGNIGGVARAMKTMGIRHLTLVNPKYFPSPEATARAAGADEILDQAKVVATLEEALQDHQVVLGASVRPRHAKWPCLTPREAMQTISHNRYDFAVVFGRESAGLSNREMDLCQYQLRIPCQAQFGSLNLASAAQVIAYEWHLSVEEHVPQEITTKHEMDEPASRQAIERLYAHLEASLDEKIFFSGRKSVTVMRKFRQIFQRLHLSVREVNLLRGALSALSNSNERTEAEKMPGSEARSRSERPNLPQPVKADDERNQGLTETQSLAGKEF